MARQMGFLDRFTEMADLQEEPIPGLPLVEIAGNQRVLIENHCGVISYGCCCIGVKVKYGEICVSGTHLMLKKMTRAQLVICGCIEQVSLQRGRNI